MTHAFIGDALPEGRSAFLSVREIADLVGISPRTVRRWIEAGRLGAVRTAPTGGVLRVPRAALLEFLEGGVVQSDSVGTEAPRA